MKFNSFERAVLAFFHAVEICKIPSVKFCQYILSIAFIALIIADDQTAEDILLKTFHRMDGINHQFKIDSKSSGKKEKEKHFQASVHWPSEGNLLRQTRITSTDSKRKKPSSFWEHRFRDGSKAKKWMSMSITGKLRDVSDKKVGKKDFSFSELGVTDEEIKSHDHTLLPRENIDTLLANMVKGTDAAGAETTPQQRINVADSEAISLINSHKYGMDMNAMQNQQQLQQQMYQQQMYQQQQQMQQPGLAGALGGFGSSLIRGSLGLPPSPTYGQQYGQYPQAQGVYGQTPQMQ